MLPNTENLDDLIVEFGEEEQASTKTFAINMTENIMGGKIDELEALKQAIYLMLGIEADQYIIYPYTYALQKVDLIGKPSHYVMAVLPGRIKDTLLSDDRITDVHDFEFEVKRRTIHTKFIVDTIYGEVKSETVVMF